MEIGKLLSEAVLGIEGSGSASDFTMYIICATLLMIVIAVGFFAVVWRTQSDNRRYVAYIMAQRNQNGRE